VTSADGAIYLDSSAIVKLIVDEPASSALRSHLAGRGDLVSSALARTEVGRALLAWDVPTARRCAVVLEGIDLVAIADAILAEAAVLQPPQLRSLDAIHVATAHQLGADLLELVTYDRRMQAAAEALGMPVAAPA
jgi:hypothetical protein